MKIEDKAFLAMISCNMADFLSTIIGLSSGRAVELNPYFTLMGIIPFFAMKILMPLFLGIGIWQVCKIARAKADKYYGSKMILYGDSILLFVMAGCFASFTINNILVLIFQIW